MCCQKIENKTGKLIWLQWYSKTGYRWRAVETRREEINHEILKYWKSYTSIIPKRRCVKDWDERSLNH